MGQIPHRSATTTERLCLKLSGQWSLRGTAYDLQVGAEWILRLVPSFTAVPDRVALERGSKPLLSRALLRRTGVRSGGERSNRQAREDGA